MYRGGGSEEINIEEDFECPSFTVLDKTYGYVTNVYFKVSRTSIMKNCVEGFWAVH